MGISNKIGKKDIKDIFALTPLQEGILFHYIKSPNSDLYFEQLSLQISGDIDVNIFKKAWNFVIKNNEMLRTTFRWEKIEKPVQVILKEHDLRFQFHDLATLNTDKDDKDDRLKKERLEKFDLKQVPFRVTLNRLEAARYELIISNHHILYDGWSNGVILGQFFNVYHDLLQQKVPQKTGQGKFKEYVRWLQEQDVKKQGIFWRTYLTGFDTPAMFPVKRCGLKEMIMAIESSKIRFAKEFRIKLANFVGRYKITVAALLYSAFGILLQRYSNSNDVIFGTTVAGRSAKIKDIENIVGLFINTIPLRVQTGSGQRIIDALSQVNDLLQIREEYETTPLVDIKKYSLLGKNEELFDALVVIENYPLPIEKIRGKGRLTINSHSMFEMTNYDLTVIVSLTDEMDINFIYNRELFDREMIERLSHHFSNILRDISENPTKELSTVDMSSPGEKEQILVGFNDTARGYPQERAIAELFVQQVEKFPDNIALIAADGAAPHYTYSLSYSMLLQEVDNLARLLLRQGLNPGEIIAIMVERSVQMVRGILAILRAGGAYLPIDPAYPAERKNYILYDSNSRLLLTGAAFSKEAEKFKYLGVEAIFIENCKGNSYVHASLDSSGTIAYIIYTSGSTGKPKGVIVENNAVVNILAALQKEYPLTATDTYLLKTSYVFDVSAAELFGWFHAGGKLAILEKEGEKDPQKIIAAIENAAVTHINFVPSMFNVFVDELHSGNIHKLSSLKYIFAAGEEILPHLVQRFRKLDMKIVLENIYGPTEGTIYSSKFSLSGWNGKGSIPIGIPLQNIELYILDRNNHLLPIGAIGELYITGDGLARGYLNRPELTAKSFVSNYNRPYKSYFFEKMYKTGDLARWLPDGNIEFLGRMDYQVKIRGFRIDLGEIENHLVSHPAVKEAVVTIKDDAAGDKYLCAYVVSRALNIITQALRDYLSQTLPGYMIPSYFVFLEKLPLTVTGKLDRSKLPEPAIKTDREYTPPGDDIEKKLVEIWADILHIDHTFIGIDDRFFELGGHSLKITGLLGRIQKEFDTAVSFTEVFSRPTVRGIADHIRRKGKKEYPGLQAVEKREYYPLSPGQKRLYILQRMENDSLVYNMPGIMRIEGEINKEKFEQVFIKLIERHESLRTSFLLIEGEPQQRVHNPRDIEFKIENPQSITKTIENFICPFDLSRAPLLRVALIKCEQDEYILSVDMHHIISDGASLEILIKEFTALFKEQELAAIPFQYKDYSRWIGAKQEQEAIRELETYWLGEFPGEIPLLNLPSDFSRPLVQSFAGDRFGFELGEAETAALKSLAVQENATLYMVLLALFNVFLSRLGGQEDIVVGTPISGRRQIDLANIMGMFVNTLALRNYPVGEKRFREFLAGVTQKAAAAFENQEYQFEKLVEKLEVKRDPGRNPIFDVLFTVQDGLFPAIRIPGLALTPIEYYNGTAKFDLTFNCELREGQLDYNNETGSRDEARYLTGAAPQVLNIAIEYCRLLFTEETIKRYAQYFKKIVTEVIDNNDVGIGAIEILPGEEKKLLLYDFNEVAGGLPDDRTLLQLFAHQVEKNPDEFAVVFSGEKVTYRELDEKSDRLAHVLVKLGVSSPEPAALLVDRSLEMIIGILGVLKTGCAYVPLNPQAPLARTKYILNECGIKALLTSRARGESLRLPDVGIKTIIIDAGDESLCSPDPDALDKLSPRPTDIAYVIFTSGSTGKPKGVPISHANLCPLLHWGYKDLAPGPGDRTLQNLSYYFDWSVWEIFITLTTGATLYIVPEETMLNPGVCIDFMTTERITILHATPTQFQYLMGLRRRFEILKYLFIGAEKLSCELVERSFAAVNEQCRVFNMYGPTEATIIAAVLEIERRNCTNYKKLSSIPIGAPVANTCLFVLDRYLNPCPLNVLGELYIAGGGLSRGYLNNPEMTAEKFVSCGQGDPRRGLPLSPDLSSGNIIEYPQTDHCTLNAPPRSGVLQKSPLGNRKFYKTGDLVRWLPDGNIEFLGRSDYQVKIRGFRIELGEIEKHISDFAGVKEAVVLDRQSETGEKYLCAYLVLGQATEPQRIASLENDSSELRRFLVQALPDYMIPSYFIFLDRIPLNPNGKVDRKALPLPDMTQASGGYSPPRNALEKKLVAIWSEVLNIDRHALDIDTDFFEVGGHSLKATQLTARIHQELNVDIKLAEIFKMSTIRGLSAYIAEAVTERFFAIAAREERQYYLLSSAQMRLYLLQRIEPAGIGYNMPAAILLEGALDKEKLTAAFVKLIHRHESLRTYFVELDGQPVQRVSRPLEIDVEIEYHDLEKKKNKPRDAQLFQGEIDRTIRHFIRSFDLAESPLMRVGLVNIGEMKHILMLDMHHIIFDGTSMDLFIRDFMAFYSQAVLPPLRVQYPDYSNWQRADRNSAVLKEQEEYWTTEFCGEIPILDLPTDYSRPLIQDFAGACIHFELDKEESAALQRLAQTEAVTLYMLLLALINILLSKLSSQEDIIIGTAAAGRQHADLAAIIGMFVNTLAMRNYPTPDKTFTQFLAEVKERTLSAFENQGYQFEELVERVAVQHDTGRNPLFDVMFALQNMAMTRIEIPGLKLEPHEYDSGLAKFDITFFAGEIDGILRFTFEYCTKLFKPGTISGFIRYFRAIIEAVLRDPGVSLGDIEIISVQERRQILYEFNNKREEYPIDKTIPQLFADQAARTPDHIALVGAKHADIGKSGAISQSVSFQLTYRQLDETSTRLAHSLIKNNSVGDDLIGIMAHRSLEMIVGILGILKSGCGYVPLNPQAPPARTKYILDECNIKEALYPPDVEAINESPGTLCPPGTTDIAYVIFTSGSTGNPKGVLIDHTNFCPLIFWGYQHLGLHTHDRVIQNLSYYFDWSVWEIFITLTSGASLYIIPEDMLLDPEAQVDFLKKNDITVLHITPTHCQYLVNLEKRLDTLKYLIIGAEKLPYDLVKHSLELVKKDCRIFNMYGPTEATIISAMLEVDRRAGNDTYKYLSSVPIGEPSANITLLVLDKNRRLCPVNISGELFIGGDAISRGYLNNPELTAEKFTSSGQGAFLKNRPLHPQKTFINRKSFCGGQGGSFLEKRPLALVAEGNILYKTGDLVRWLTDGNIEFLGRLDDQVKIRGFRIELGEIENRILEFPQVKEAVVLDRPSETGGKYLCAYIVSRAGEPIDAALLRDYLAQHLPDYMIPAHFITLEKMPLNPNGKIDRKALPEPGYSSSGRRYVPPRNETEQKLAEIWRQLLKVDRIGIHDNFFEIGGHSLKVLGLVNAIKKDFQVKIDFQDVFRCSTIAALHGFIAASQVSRYRGIPNLPKQSHYEISYTQRRLWLLYNLEPDNPAFNLGGRLTLNERVDEKIIRQVLDKLVARHESFRTYFTQLGGEAVQIIRQEAHIQLAAIDLTSLPGEALARARNRLFVEEDEIPFNLERAPLFRAKLIKCRDDEYDLVFTMHHIISDGWSLEVLEQEFRLFYESYKQGSEYDAPILRIGYKDYAAWHNRLLADENEIKTAIDFWSSQLSGELTAPDLPYDSAKSKQVGKKSAAYRIVIPEALTLKLRQTALEHKASLFMALLAGYNLLLAALSGQDDIVFGVAGAARQHDDLKNIIGFFVNTLILRERIIPGESFSSLLARVQANMLQVLEHQGFPLELICTRLKIRYPEISTFFNMVTFGEDNRQELTNLESFHTEEVQNTKFDMVWYLKEYRNGVEIETHYYKELFEPSSIERIMQKYIGILEGISCEINDSETTNNESKKIKAKKNFFKKVEFRKSESN